MSHPISFPCARCGAAAGQPCQGKRGDRKAFHRERGGQRNRSPLAEVERDRTDSPIEHIMLSALVEWIDHHEAHYAYVATQAPFGPYRADIMVTVGERRLVVECDGSTYHNHARMIEHDKRRDRYCTLNGIAVLRFTGQEITRDPRGCAAQVGVWIRGRG